MISTRGRYALRVLVDIAEHGNGHFVKLDEIAQRQGLSEKYLESILAALTKHGLLHGKRSSFGGYMLTKPPQEYTIGSILQVTENTLAPVACLKESAAPCKNRQTCKTVAFWEEYFAVINDFLEKKTLADLLNGQADKAPCACPPPVPTDLSD